MSPSGTSRGGKRGRPLRRAHTSGRSPSERPGARVPGSGRSPIPPAASRRPAPFAPSENSRGGGLMTETFIQDVGEGYSCSHDGDMMDVRAEVTRFAGASLPPGLVDAWHWSPAPGIGFAGALSGDGERLLQLSGRDSYDAELATRTLAFAREHEHEIFARNAFIGALEGFVAPGGTRFDAVVGIAPKVHPLQEREARADAARTARLPRVLLRVLRQRDTRRGDHPLPHARSDRPAPRSLALPEDEVCQHQDQRAQYRPRAWSRRFRPAPRRAARDRRRRRQLRRVREPAR